MSIFFVLVFTCLFCDKVLLMENERSSDFIAKVNGFEFCFTREQIESADILAKGNNEYHLLKGHMSFTGTATPLDSSGKNQVIEIEGERLTVQIKDQLDQMLDTMGFSAGSGRLLKEIKAPMPGLVLEVNVTEGQQVKEGDKLLILVAMKMENSITIQADATIKKINVSAGQAVEKGQVLIELDSQ
jgi:biotin carboxyl carrier protein